jgi:hypothetical protein
LPDTMLKLAKQHDPEAKIESFYPGQLPSPKGEYQQHDSITGLPSWDEQRVLPYSDEDVRRFTPAHPKAERGGSNTPYGTSARKVTDIAMSKDSDGNPYFELVVGNPADVHVSEGIKSPGDPNKWLLEPKRHYSTVKNAVFRSRAAAERAMQEINETLAQAQTERKSMTPEDLAKAWEIQHGGSGEPYQGIRLSDEMAESIRKYGFPLFANPAQMGLPAFAAMMEAALAQDPNQQEPPR